MRRVGLVTAAAIAALFVGALSASGGDVSGKDTAGDVKARGLTKAERDAIDVVSVRAIGQAGLGVFVIATFRGNFQKAIGRGHLKTGLAALVLVPKAGAGEPAGVVTEGSGADGKILRRTRSAAVGAVRGGKTVAFFVAGPGYENVASVGVRTLARSPAALRMPAGGEPPTVPDQVWKNILKIPADRADLLAHSGTLTCAELESLEDLIVRRQISLLAIKLTDSDEYAALLGLSNAVRGALASPPCGTGPSVRITLTWDYFDSTEVAGKGSVAGPAATVLNDLRVVLPERFTIINKLCPNQLPNASLHGSIIDCTGGTLHTGEQFSINLRTSPGPTAGMGGQVFVVDGNGTQYGPFSATGP